MTTTTPRPDARPDARRDDDPDDRPDDRTGPPPGPEPDRPAVTGSGGDIGDRAARAAAADDAEAADGGPAPDESPLPTDDPARDDGPRTTLRLGHPRELLALVPYLLGFPPRDSAVLVALRPPGHRLGLVARADLPDLVGPGGPRLAAELAAHLRADGAAEVVVVLYAGEGDPRDPERGLRPTTGSRAARAAGLLARAVAGLGPVTVWSVDDGRYLGLDCRDRSCCPVGGRPLADLSGGELAARLVARRGGLAGSRDELGLVRPAAPGPRRSASAARSRSLDALLRADGPDAVLRWRQRSLAAWRAALAEARAPSGARPGPAALGRLEAALLDPVVRDAVVLALVAPDDPGLPDALLRTGPTAWTRAGASWADDGWSGADGWPGEDRAASDGRDAARDDRAGVTDVRGAARDDGTCVPDGRDAGPGASDADADAVSGRVRDALDLLVDPVRGREPDADLAGAGRAVLERVVAHGRRDRQAPALTLLALLAWWDGDAVRAAVLVERALDQDPSHRLAELLDRALGAGLPPGWVRRGC